LVLSVKLVVSSTSRLPSDRANHRPAGGCSVRRADVRPIVRHHHERLDGTGYPDKLTGDRIPLLAQIMSIVDAYDAMTTERPYKPAATPDHARHELREDAAKGWKSATLVEEFVSITLWPRSDPLVAPSPGTPEVLDLWRG
jgi:hypothetical protein